DGRSGSGDLCQAATVTEPPRSTRPLAAAPVSPEVASVSVDAPELAPEAPPLVAVASPVAPDEPELPESAPSPEAAPVAPVGPELPETATGAATAVEDAAPVAAVFVAEDWPVAGPVAPERAKGATVRARLPLPPPAVTSTVLAA